MLQLLVQNFSKAVLSEKHHLCFKSFKENKMLHTVSGSHLPSPFKSYGRRFFFNKDWPTVAFWGERGKEKGVLDGLNGAQSCKSLKVARRASMVGERERSLAKASSDAGTLFLVARSWLAQTKRNLRLEGRESRTWLEEGGGGYQRVRVSCSPHHVLHPLLRASWMFLKGSL